MDRNERLSFFSVKRNSPIAYSREINCRKVDTANGTVVHRAIIDDPIRDVGHGSPLRSTGNIDRYLAIGKLYTDGNIEVVQYLKTLTYGIFSLGQQGCCCLPNFLASAVPA